MQSMETSMRRIALARAVKFCLYLLVAAAAIQLRTPPALAQTAMASISGHVTDQSDAAVPDATIEIKNTDTQIMTSAKTGAQGFYVVPSLQPGTYDMRVTKTGFRVITVSALTLGVQASVTHDFVLEIGSASETVNVSADASSELLQNTSSELGTVVGEKAIRELPLNGRNFTELLSLTPGAIPVSTAQSSGVGVNDLANLAPPTATIAQPTIQGQFNRSNLYMLDGVANSEITTSTYIIPPIVDAMQEFKVQSHNDKAEYGSVLGGVVDVVTRSGTNSLHASAWEFIRNNAFDARDSFRDQYLTGPSPFHQNQFGAMASGPVWIPKVYNGHNRTFFLFAYEGWRYDQASQTRYRVPTASELSGDFSNSILDQAIYDPATTRPDPNNPSQLIRDQFPGNVIPAGRIDQTALNFIKAYFNQPNLTGDPVYNAITSHPNTNDSDHYMARIDEQLGKRDSIFFRYDRLNVTAASATSNTQVNGASVPADNIGVGWTHVFGPSLLWDNRYGLTSRPFSRYLTDAAGIGPMEKLGFSSAGGSTFTLSSPWGNGGVSLANTISSPVNDLSESVTWVRGVHNLKFGLQYFRFGTDTNSPPYGAFNFSNDTTGSPEAVGTTGSSLASALLGLPSQSNNSGAVALGERVSTWSSYGQDSWNLRNNITLTYGLRYDHRRSFAPDSKTFVNGPNSDGTYWIGMNQMPSECGATGPTPCIPGGLSSVPYNDKIALSPYGRSWGPAPQWDEWGPRVGVAWRPTNRMVVRGGYGIVYDPLTGIDQDWKGFAGSWPAVGSIFSNVALNQLGQPLTPIDNVLGTVGIALPAPTPWNQSNWYMDPHHRDGRSQQWNVEIEREMSKDIALSIGYVGSTSDRLDATGLWDTAQTPGPGTPDEVQARKPFPWYQATSFYGTDRGYGRYHSLQAKLNRHFSNGLQYLVSYTFSKAIDAGSSGWFGAENGAGGGSNFQNYYDLNGSRSVSSFDIPQFLSMSGQYELPVGKGKTYLNHGLASWVLGNWQMNGVFQLRSGQPYTMSVPGDVANIGNTISWWNYARPNLVGNPNPSHPTALKWFEPSAFAVPSFSYGNTPRNFMRSSHVTNGDLSLFKNFGLGEAATLSFRAEAFNVFNIQNYGAPNSLVGDPNEGRITSNVLAPRQLQFGLHLQY